MKSSVMANDFQEGTLVFVASGQVIEMIKVEYPQNIVRHSQQQIRITGLAHR